MTDWLILDFGKWWKVGIHTDHLRLVFGWSFERYRIGIEVEWGKQHDQAPYLRRHRYGVFLPLGRCPNHRRRQWKPSTNKGQ